VNSRLAAEGDILVIDTVGVKVGPFAMLDMFGTPSTEALHVIERYRLLDYEAVKEWNERGQSEYRRGERSDPGFTRNPGYKGKGWSSNSRSRTRMSSRRPGRRGSSINAHSAIGRK
jgi:hypothetical protein